MGDDGGRPDGRCLRQCHDAPGHRAGARTLPSLMRSLASAEVIAVGSELLTPDRLDTNSLVIADRLRALGILLRAKAVVGDRPDDLAAVFRGALARADLVLLIGGLGPTDDDVTRDVVASALDLPLTE